MISFHLFINSYINPGFSCFIFFHRNEDKMQCSGYDLSAKAKDLRLKSER